MTDRRIPQQASTAHWIRLVRICAGISCISIIATGVWLFHVDAIDDSLGVEPTVIYCLMFTLPIIGLAGLFLPVKQMIQWNSRSNRRPGAMPRAVPASTINNSTLWDRELDVIGLAYPLEYHQPTHDIDASHYGPLGIEDRVFTPRAIIRTRPRKDRIRLIIVVSSVIYVCVVSCSENRYLNIVYTVLFASAVLQLIALKLSRTRPTPSFNPRQEPIPRLVLDSVSRDSPLWDRQLDGL